MNFFPYLGESRCLAGPCVGQGVPQSDGGAGCLLLLLLAVPGDGVPVLALPLLRPDGPLVMQGDC